ncbi:hypothetical protein A2773_06660 [Candidatus Gottesmanbacteria bacterium RIFCSPHIGHO2_01_FULL_39_10]|uniref:PIN domain-containing protein n=1 Tax=Candidatus Gottesmanbacteria bacterium RIFCSPHIGHO2_01_FULL_39_10 TaxID=1798375 RepID=A0A1F5ZP44_9BACT|nr:MAG: hypothetical protein A2773_06660 [Candidatus Gottesmanbacteria bacterium RIFCSPHIGHO2_01_FULL_39_10]
MKIYILDASFIVRTITEKSSKADLFLRSLLTHQKAKEIQLYSIPFVLIETANAFRFTFKDKSITLKSQKICANLPLTYYYPTNTDIERALEWSYQHQTTVYDSLYHVVATILDGTFLTCDEDYYKKAKSEGAIKLLN